MGKIQLVVECKGNDNCESRIMSLGTIVHRLPMIDSYIIEVLESDINKLSTQDFVKTFHHDTKIQAQMNVARKVVKADVVQNKGYSGKNINVAILDTGISPVNDFVYPKNRIVGFKDVVNNKSECYDDNGHGTHVWCFKS